MQNPNRSKKLWENINELKGEDKEKHKMVGLYNKEATKVKQEAIPQKLEKYWKSIYQKWENDTTEIWNSDKGSRYEDKMTTYIGRNMYKRSFEHCSV